MYDKQFLGSMRLDGANQINAHEIYSTSTTFNKKPFYVFYLFSPSPQTIHETSVQLKNGFLAREKARYTRSSNARGAPERALVDRGQESVCTPKTNEPDLSRCFQRDFVRRETYFGACAEGTHIPLRSGSVACVAGRRQKMHWSGTVVLQL